MARCYFPKAHSSIIRQTGFNPYFHPRMATFSKLEFKIPYNLFWFADKIKWMPYNLTLNPSGKTIVDNAAPSPVDFGYLISCRPNVLIFRSVQKIRVEVYRSARFGKQLGYHQQLPRVVDSSFLVKMTFMTNIYWWECMLHLTGSSLEVSPPFDAECYRSVWHWWHKVPETTCAVVHISRPPTASKRRGSRPKCLFLWKILPPEVGRGEVAKSSLGVRRPYRLRLPRLSISGVALPTSPSTQRNRRLKRLPLQKRRRSGLRKEWVTNILEPENSLRV